MLSGDWKLDGQLPSAGMVERETTDQQQPVTRIIFDARELEEWDSSLLSFLSAIYSFGSQRDIAIDASGLPRGVQRLLELATTAADRKESRREIKKPLFLARTGEAVFEFWLSVTALLFFIGETNIAFYRTLTGRSTFRRSDLLVEMQECGAQALPIVSLISVLVGLILAFIGAIQLKLFGAQIYVANLVGIGMVRALAPIMTGVIMAGRTGASYAARLGSMQVNEEIDALKTLGISPMEFLVVPRMVALFVMMPLLCLYADIMGIIGGMIVGVTVLDIDFMQYYVQTKAALNLRHLFVGLFSGAVFGVLVALSGCMRGMQCGRSASAVGDATTSSVVTSIVSIVVATAIITLTCNVLRI